MYRDTALNAFSYKQTSEIVSGDAPLEAIVPVPPPSSSVYFKVRGEMLASSENGEPG